MFPSSFPTVGAPAPSAPAFDAFSNGAAAAAAARSPVTQSQQPASFTSIVSSSAAPATRAFSAADLGAQEQKIDRCVAAERLCRHALSSLHFQVRCAQERTSDLHNFGSHLTVQLFLACAQDAAGAFAKLSEAMQLLKPLVAE